MNIIAEKKVKTSSVKYFDRGANLDLPGPSMRELNQRVEQVRMHQVGATNPKRSTANVKNEMKHQVSSYSPRDRGEAAIAKP